MNLFSPPPQVIQLRPYQDEAVERLRDGIRQGCRRQILVAPTGAGKTLVAMNIIAEAQKKGASAWFIVDRVTLIDQTSTTFADYGIDHGIIQADNIYTDMSKPVQVASAQTLARRKTNWLPDLIVVDEAHCRYQSTINVIERATNAKVIGLTATPFTDGMAEDWDGLVNITTVNKLLADGFLTPLKIKACVSPDMKGVRRKFTGEYDEEESGERGITIVGNVVDTWVEQTHKHFRGRPRPSCSRRRSGTAPRSAGSSPPPATISSRSATWTRTTPSAAPRSPSSGSPTAASTAWCPARC